MPTAPSETSGHVPVAGGALGAIGVYAPALTQHRGNQREVACRLLEGRVPQGEGRKPYATLEFAGRLRVSCVWSRVLAILAGIIGVTVYFLRPQQTKIRSVTCLQRGFENERGSGQDKTAAGIRSSQ